jgi:hypothetical protein
MPFQIPRFVFVILGCLVIATAFGVYSYKSGYSAAKNKYQLVISNLEKDSLALKAELEKANANITESVIIEYVDREKVIYQNRIAYRDVVREVLVPSSCSLTTGWVEVHDAAAKQKQVNLSDSATEYSQYSDIDGLLTVVDNYSTCYQTSNQLTALQQWVRENYEQINGVKYE